MHYANPNYLSAAMILALVSAAFFLWALRHRKKVIDRFMELARARF